MASVYKNFWVYEIISSYDPVLERAVVHGARVLRISDGMELSFSGESAVGDLIQALCDHGAREVFCWDMSFTGMFMDTWALRNGLKPYDEADFKRNPVTGHKMVSEPCFRVLYARGRGILAITLTLPRARSTHGSGGGKVGQFHSVEYRGISTFFPGEQIEDVMKHYGIDQTGLEALRALLPAFLDSFSDAVGEDARTLKYLRSVYTVGGAARRRYLMIRYPNRKAQHLKKYQKDHFAAEEVDEYLRARHLQLGGMCMFPGPVKGNLISGVPVYKYDVNGLYTATANACGELSYPEPCDGLEFETCRDQDLTYIVVMRGLIAYRKSGVPPVFMDQVGGGNGDVIDIPGEIAMFRELFEGLKKFYDFEELEFVKFLRLRKKPDPAIVEYNAFYVDRKTECTLSGDIVGRTFAKLMLNNLVGKFTQSTKTVEMIGKYNPDRDIVEFAHGRIIDNWEHGHFDFIRGAYIYTMARVKVMNDILEYLGGEKESFSHHLYTDTDSIVTDIHLPDEEVDATRLGAYKLEETYTAFGVVGKKVYYGRSAAGDKLTAAGFPKGLIMRELHDTYGDDLTPEEIWVLLNSGITYEVPVTVRVKNGGARISRRIRIGDIDFDKIIQH